MSMHTPEYAKPGNLQYILFDRDEVQIFLQKPQEMDSEWSLYVGPEGGYLSVSKLELADVTKMIEVLQNVAADMIPNE